MNLEISNSMVNMLNLALLLGGNDKQSIFEREWFHLRITRSWH